MSEIKLKPCPFCDESPVVKEYDQKIRYEKFIVTHEVSCRKCDIGFVRNSEFTFKNGQPDFVRNGYEEAVALWNTRANKN